MRYCFRGKTKVDLFYRIMNFISWVLFKLFYSVKIYGQDHFPKGAAIIAANHASYLDPPLLGLASPEEVHYLAKQSLFKIPVFGFIIRKINSHPLKGDVGDVAVFKTILTLLEKGKKVVLFPEGQRSFDNTLNPIKPGLSLLVSKTDAYVIPTYVFGTFEAWPRTNIFPRLWKNIGCVFGSPINWSEFSHLDKKSAQFAFASKLTDAIQQLKIWHDNGAKNTPP